MVVHTIIRQAIAQNTKVAQAEVTEVTEDRGIILVLRALEERKAAALVDGRITQMALQMLGLDRVQHSMDLEEAVEVQAFLLGQPMLLFSPAVLDTKALAMCYGRHRKRKERKLWQASR